MHGQADHGLGLGLGDRQTAGLRIDRIDVLSVHRDRVVDRRRHALGLQVRGQAVPILVLDGVLRPDGNAALDHRRNGRHVPCKPLGVTVGDDVAQGDLFGEQLELLDQHRRLDGIQPRVHADAHVQVLGVVVEGAAGDVARHGLAMHPQAVEQLGQGGVIGQDRPAVAVAAQRLGRKEAGGDDVGPMAGMVAVQGATEPLRTVGDQLEAVFPGHRRDGRIVGGLAEQVDGNDHLGRQLTLGLHRLDGGVELDRIEIVGVRQHVDEHRRGARPGHDFARRREGEARAEDRVARPDPPGPQRQGDGVCAVGARHAVPGPGERGQFGLKLTHLRPHHIGAVIEHPGDGRVQLRTNPALLGGEVDESDAHGEALGLTARRS